MEHENEVGIQCCVFDAVQAFYESISILSVGHQLLCLWQHIVCLGIS